MSEGIAVVVLGVGSGSTHVYHGECSSSFLLLVDDEPTLLIDCGYGAVQACLRHTRGRLPPHVYVSHNHSDHAGELPVLLAVQALQQSKMTVHAEREVLERLRHHRLHELLSTGKALEAFGSFQALTPQQPHPVTSGIQLTPFQAAHAERCFGFLMSRRGVPLLGFTADSGFCPALYRQLAAAPTLLVDARRQPGSEHASFVEVGCAAADGLFEGRSVYVHGYGRLSEAAGVDELPSGVACAIPGQVIRLGRPRAAAGGDAARLVTAEAHVLTKCV